MDGQWKEVDGLLGVRAQLHGGSFDKITYAPYAANCIVWGSRLSAAPHARPARGETNAGGGSSLSGEGGLL